VESRELVCVTLAVSLPGKGEAGGVLGGGEAAAALPALAPFQPLPLPFLFLSKKGAQVKKVGTGRSVPFPIFSLHRIPTIIWSFSSASYF